MGKLSVLMLFHYILTIIIVCSAIDSRVWRSNKGPYKFLKVSIVWPPSFCNTNDTKIDCTKPFIKHFVIHGAWPMYTATRWVGPYNTTGCSTIEPVPKDNITTELLGSLLPDMIRLWPDIEFYLDNTVNEGFWKYQWEKHGMCFKNPDDPTIYFGTALNIIKTYKFLEKLDQGGYKPDNEFYNATEMATSLNEALGMEAAEIRCNTNKLENKQLLEIWVYFDKEDNLKLRGQRPSIGNCPTDQLIQFPSAELDN